MFTIKLRASVRTAKSLNRILATRVTTYPSRKIVDAAVNCRPAITNDSMRLNICHRIDALWLDRLSSRCRRWHRGRYDRLLFRCGSRSGCNGLGTRHGNARRRCRRYDNWRHNDRSLLFLHLHHWATGVNNITSTKNENCAKGDSKVVAIHSHNDKDSSINTYTPQAPLFFQPNSAYDRRIMPITISVTINAPVEKVWTYYTEPEHLMQWNFASDDWMCPSATNDLRVGGTFTSRMEAKDGSFGFDFGGTYSEVVSNERIVYSMSDGRKVELNFSEQDGVTAVETIFDAEKENPEEMQREGWQAILNNFKKHVESN